MTDAQLALECRRESDETLRAALARIDSPAAAAKLSAAERIQAARVKAAILSVLRLRATLSR